MVVQEQITERIHPTIYTFLYIYAFSIKTPAAKEGLGFRVSGLWFLEKANNHIYTRILVVKEKRKEKKEAIVCMYVKNSSLSLC
jgi:hypothetical protein